MYCPRFIGRERELAALSALARRAAAGEGAIAFVSGEAGAGKTRFIEEAGRHLPRGMRRYRAACLEYAPSPMGPVVDILADLEADEGASAGGTGLTAPTGDDQVDKRRLFERVTATLRKAGARAPLVAVIDDAHWADSATLDLLQFAIGTLQDARVLLVVLYRADELTHDHPLHAVISRAVRARHVHRIELRALSQADVREMIDATLSPRMHIPVESLRGVLARSEGNPLFAEELLKAVVDDERSGVTRQTLPDSLRGLLHERLRRLAPGDMALLEIAALIGRRFGASFLARIGGRDPASLEAFLRMAIDEHFLVEDAADPGCFTFRHALTRDTILAGVLAMHARTMHLVIAREIEREPDHEGRIVELAEHYWRAAAFAECAGYAQTAGDLAKTRHAYAQAAELYERALACGAADERGLVALHEKAAAAYASLGAPQKVLDHLQVAVDHYTATHDTVRLVEAYIELAQGLRRIAQTDRAFAVLRRASELSLAIDDDALLMRIAVQLALLHALAEEWPEVEAALRAAEPSIAQAGPRDAIRFYSARAALRLAEHDLDGWERDSELAASIARAHGDPTLVSFALTSYGVDARKIARFDSASASFREAAEAGSAYGPLYNATFARLGHANVLYLTGELRAAHAEMLEVLADVHESTTVRMLVAQFGVALAVVLRDEALAARCYSPDLLEAAFSTNEPIQYASFAAAVAEHHLANGDEAAAVALLERMLASLPGGWSDCEALLPVAVCCSQADVARARVRFDEARDEATNPFAHAYRELFDAYAEARFGTRDAKLRHAKTAAMLLHRLGMPLLEAEAYELAEEPARAVALCEKAGAARLPRRLGPRSPRRSTATQLTAREREVVDVALRGMSNSAIADELSLSERTVEAHLAAAYRKLGVRSRGELISVLGREP